jgi:hypothetical protein
MYTKTITQDIDWLNAIDGRTVRAAIDYLRTLNPEHLLNYNLEGDTHGCSVESDVSYTVPMTNKEILEGLEKHYATSFAKYEKSKQYYIDRGQLDRLPAVDRLIHGLKAKLEDARAKYSQPDDNM